MCPLILDATSSVYLYLIRFKSVSSNDDDDDDYEDDNVSTESLPFVVCDYFLVAIRVI